MSETNTQTPTNENASAEPQETGSDEAAVAALMGKVEPEEPKETETEAAPADEPETESDAEPDTGETEEEEATDELVEAELEGKTYKVAPEVEKALLRQADYSRKMNAVAVEQKLVTQQKETADRLLEGAEKYAEVLAEAKQLDARLKEFDQVQWQRLRQENPAEYAALSADLNTLRLSRETAMQKAKGLDAELRQTKDQDFAAKREAMTTTLQKDLKGWGDEMGTKITQYAVQDGWQLEDIARLTDAKVVKALHKAMKYDALQTGKVALKAKTQDVPPVLKRGAPVKADPSKDAMAQLRKSNSTEDAIRAFMQR
jgi:hypothetical protein